MGLEDLKNRTPFNAIIAHSMCGINTLVSRKYRSLKLQFISFDICLLLYKMEIGPCLGKKKKLYVRINNNLICYL